MTKTAPLVAVPGLPPVPALPAPEVHPSEPVNAQQLAPGLVPSPTMMVAPPPVEPGDNTSEYRLAVWISALLQLFVAVWTVLMGAGLVHIGDPWGTGVPLVLETIQGWIVTNYTRQRTLRKNAAGFVTPGWSILLLLAVVFVVAILALSGHLALNAGFGIH